MFLQELLLSVPWYFLWLAIPLFFIAAYFVLKKEAKKYHTTKDSKHVFKMIGVFFIVAFLTYHYIGYVTFLGDTKRMSALGYEWREVDKFEKGFYKHIDSYDVYVNLIHASGYRAYREPYTAVKIFSKLKNFDLLRYFCNQESLDDFVKSRGFSSGGGFSKFANGYPSDKCFKSSIEKAIANLPSKKHRFTGWSGLPSFIPLPISDNRYYILIENDEINLDTFKEELKDFIGFYDVLTSSS